MNHEGMKFSLVSRELIADSIEAVVRGHAYDGLVAFGGCDKTLPGAMMGLVRCNLPGVFVYGGAALPGRFAGRDVTVLDAYEGVGAVQTGAMAEADLALLERACKPSVGACAGQFTANTMAMVAEALGLTVPNSAMVPGVYSRAARDRAARRRDRDGDAGTRRPAAARSRHAQVAGERERHRGGDRRLDQCGAAHSGDRERGRHPLHGGRRGGGVRAHAADRRSAAGRKVSRQGRLREWRRVGDHPRADRERAHARRPDRHGPHARRGARRRRRARRRGGARGRQCAAARRRARGAEGQSRARRRAAEGRGAEGARIRRHRARVRFRRRLRRARSAGATTRQATCW